VSDFFSDTFVTMIGWTHVVAFLRPQGSFIGGRRQTGRTGRSLHQLNDVIREHGAQNAARLRQHQLQRFLHVLLGV
jgi:hypothetical protein